jgi:KDO2-lipid IV(A) lauroyltransferase
MEAFTFYIFFILNWTITLLPFRVLYIFSDFLFVIFYYFPGYRKKDVYGNLRNAFPYKTENEREEIARRFYHHLADLFIETLKMTHVSKKELLKRCVFENPELLDRLCMEGKDAVVVLGHYNNWEIMELLPTFTKYTCITIYKPLQNKHFDTFLKRYRTKYGIVVTPMSMVLKEILNRRKNGERTASFFLADQTPTISEIHYWTRFLNQDTPVYLGPEKIAMKYDMAVVFLNPSKVKRGHYSVRFDLLYDSTAGLKEYQVTEAHVKHLESIISEKPEYWVWSHRRWKHKKENIDV